MNLKDRAIALYKDGFGEDSQEFVDFFFDNVYSADNFYYDETNGVITCGLHVVYKKLCYCGSTVCLPYVVGASTLTHLRGKGLIIPVMHRALSELKSQNLPFAALYPFKHSYYERKFEFAAVDRARVRTLNCIKKSGYTVSGEINCDLIYNIYKERCAAFDNYIYRTKSDMLMRINQHMCENNNEILTVFFNGKAVGYSFISCGQSDETVMLPPHKPNHVYELNSLKLFYQGCGKDKNVMFRVLSPTAAITTRTYGHDITSEFNLNVKDKFLGAERLSCRISGGKAECAQHLIQNAPTHEISPYSLTKLLMGNSVKNPFAPVFADKYNNYFIDKF